jgi:hypothetical protein
MSAAAVIPGPPAGFTGKVNYAIRPRDKRSFHTVLDAHKLLSSSASRTSVVEYAHEGDDVVLRMEHPMGDGRIHEELRLRRRPDGLVARALSRQMRDASGGLVRGEEVPDFHQDRIGLPHATYPEVALPFLLGWIPADGARRSVYAWINDRFIAKVYIEVASARATLTVGGQTREVVEVEMYPDLNDWVAMGAVLTRLAKPFLPKYHMWYERRAPHRLVKFEGPYGPPGAPEIVLEMAAGG